MPKWLQGMVAPTVSLYACMFAFGLVYASSSPDGEIPARADLLSRVALALVIAGWVMADARKRGRRLCYDYDNFVFFAWPVVVPIYLFQTRGLRAFYTAMCFFGLSMGGAAFGAGLSFILRHLHS
jgi:hypothetical protein